MTTTQNNDRIRCDVCQQLVDLDAALFKPSAGGAMCRDCFLARRDGFIMASLLEQAQAFRRDLEQRAKPLMTAGPNCDCSFCRSVATALDRAEQLEKDLERAVEDCQTIWYTTD